MRLIFVFSFVFQISRKQFSFFKVIIVITSSWTFSSAIPLISSTEPVWFLYLPDTTALVSSKCSVLSTLYFAILSGGLNFFPFLFWNYWPSIGFIEKLPTQGLVWRSYFKKNFCVYMQNGYFVKWDLFGNTHSNYSIEFFISNCANDHLLYWYFLLYFPLLFLNWSNVSILIYVVNCRVFYITMSSNIG